MLLSQVFRICDVWIEAREGRSLALSGNAPLQASGLLPEGSQQVSYLGNPIAQRRYYLDTSGPKVGIIPG